MSAIRLMRYEDSTVTATDDAILHNLMYPHNGIIKGVEMEYIGGAQISVSAGRGIIKGRDFEVEEQIVLAELTNGKDQPGRIIIRMDLANVDNPICFVAQVGSNGQLPPLTQEENCNYTAGIYEIPIATYTAKVNMITDFKVVYKKVVQWNVLKTQEEIQANTNPDNLPSAVVVGELFNNLAQQPEWVKDSTGKITGYKTQAGADTVFPFKTDIKLINYSITSAHLNAGLTFSINGLNPNHEYYLVLMRGNLSSSGPTIIVQEPSVSGSSGCKLLSRLGYGFYKCIPNTSNISISIASANGGGYFYQAVCLVLG